jgi:DNA mismatch repair protein MutL
MYILAPIKNGIVIIDQHAAHERILYEEALQSLKRGRTESQRLLFPVMFDMSPAEKEIVVSSREYFNALGFDVQDFGGRTIAVSAMPATGFMKSAFIEEAVREMVGNLIEEKDRDILSEPQRHFAASFACGSAIKFGQELKLEEMNSLLTGLFATENPYICPHGRPTLVRISLEDLGRRFLR